jgi:hypothetical protein
MIVPFIVRQTVQADLYQGQKGLNCLCTKRVCKPVAELQREPQAIFNSAFAFPLRTTRQRSNDERVHAARLGVASLVPTLASRSLHQNRAYQKTKQQKIKLFLRLEFAQRVQRDAEAWATRRRRTGP